MLPNPSMVLPVLLAASAVFAFSFLAWMVLPHHRRDIRPLPDERPLMDAIAAMEVEPGLYMFPNCEDPADYRSEAFIARYRRGPWGTLTVRPSQPKFGVNLAVSMALYLLVAAGTAWVVSASLPETPTVGAVFVPALVIGLLAYGVGPLCGASFLGKPLRFMLTDLFDATVSAGLNAIVLALLWPGG
ncbi:MAG: hypothetical protein GY728_11980 [Phycisphaeraceae bacterium]|nr:hypothetical protein [Phycisphaeraceae bacterium]MCP4013817.1 hypothetical protein [Phycisphaeraceae bacterium]MCP4495905.1 hypothetical protein [Phycisphaeraceae bacterium]